MATKPIETSEVGVIPRLPLHDWLDKVAPAPEPFVTENIYKRPPRNRTKDFVKRDEETEVAVPAYIPRHATIRTENSSPGPIDTSSFNEDNGHDQSPQPAEAPVEIEELALATLPGMASDEMLATGGLKRILPHVRRFREVEADITNEKTKLFKNRSKALLGIGTTAVANAFTFRGENNKRKRHNLYKIGGVVVALAGIAAAAYISQKGFHNPNTTHEAVNSSPTHSTDLTSEFKFPIQTQAVIAQVGHHVHRAHQVIVRAGEGYTQVLAKYYHGKSPAELYRAYTEGVKHLGANFIRGVHHYPMNNGDYGLYEGKAHLSSPAEKFFAHFHWRR